MFSGISVELNVNMKLYVIERVSMKRRPGALIVSEQFGLNVYKFKKVRSWCDTTNVDSVSKNSSNMPSQKVVNPFFICFEMWSV